MKAAGATGALAAVGASAGTLFSPAPDAAHAEPEDKVVYQHCAVDCGGQCVLKMHIKDGELAYVESDTSGDSGFGEGFQPRACLRGRSIRQWLNGPDRLNYPMKRVEGTKRGDGQYERISWDEAIDLIASEFTRIVSTYGNEAVYCQECSGIEQNYMTRTPIRRLFNLCGGQIDRYGSYSSASITFGVYPYVYGKSGWGARSFKTLQEGELVVMFGNAPSDTRMSGDGAGYDLNVAREQKHVRIISIDPRRSEVCANEGAEWIPIKPGTDGALVAGIAHELIVSDLVDLDFLHTYCVGFDDETLPEGAEPNTSYRAYVMGDGYDRVEKTPAWASAITLIPEARIVQLAHEIAAADPCFICQGWGPQRRTNGDSGSRAIMILPLLVGQVGKPGTNSGGREGNNGYDPDDLSMSSGDNPVKAKFPLFLWPEVIKNGDKLTAENAGIQGADKLTCGIKMMVNFGNNTMAGQGADINKTTEILKDESLCEFIVSYDVNFTDSCNYADLILPDLAVQETYSMTTQGDCNDTKGIWMGDPIGEPKYERREVYEVFGEVAKKLGVYDEYSAGGLSREGWRRKVYDDFREKHSELPTYDEAVVQGAVKEGYPADAGIDPYFDDPEANPLKTETGKIQIYSPKLAEYAATWTLPEGDAIYPVPVYVPGYDGPESATDEYPLQLTGFHTKGTVHSTYACNEVLHKMSEPSVWINPIDAAERSISDGDEVAVTSAQGELRTKAKVTNRVMPGVLAMGQGYWHKADMAGDKVDHGGCLNTLTSLHPNTISKGTGQHSVLAQISKAGA